MGRATAMLHATVGLCSKKCTIRQFHLMSTLWNLHNEDGCTTQTIQRPCLTGWAGLVSRCSWIQLKQIWSLPSNCPGSKDFPRLVQQVSYDVSRKPTGWSRVDALGPGCLVSRGWMNQGQQQILPPVNPIRCTLIFLQLRKVLRAWWRTCL